MCDTGSGHKRVSMTGRGGLVSEGGMRRVTDGGTGLQGLHSLCYVTWVYGFQSAPFSRLCDAPPQQMAILP